MEDFLKNNPGQRHRYRLLLSIRDKKAFDIELSDYITSDDSEMYKYIYKKKLYKISEVRNILKKIIQEEDLPDQEKKDENINFHSGVYNFLYNSIFKKNNVKEPSEDVLNCIGVDDNSKDLMEPYNNERSDVRNPESNMNIQRRMDRLRQRRCSQSRARVLKKDRSGNDSIETKILRMLLGERILFDNFEHKLLFLKYFSKFKKRFVDCRDTTYTLTRLYFEYIYDDKIDGDLVGELFLLLDKDDILVFYNFFQGFLSSSVVSKLYDKLDFPYKPLLFDGLDEKLIYNKVSETLMSAGPKDKIKFITSLKSLDRPKLYLALSHLCMTRSLDIKNHFIKFIDVLRLLPLCNKYTACMLNSWLKAFIYYKNIDEFIKLYKQATKLYNTKMVNVNTYTVLDAIYDFKSEFDLISEYYNSLVGFKNRGVFDISIFLEKASKIVDNNAYSVYKWCDIFEIYRSK